MTFCQSLIQPLFNTFGSTFSSTLSFALGSTFGFAFSSSFFTFGIDIVTKDYNIIQVAVIRSKLILGHAVQFQPLTGLFQTGSCSCRRYLSDNKSILPKDSWLPD